MIHSLLLATLAVTTPTSDVRTGVLFDGWYADPLICRYADGYWIYPSVSHYQKEIVVDAFHSTDLKTWTKHPKVLSTNGVAWARCLWAPHAVEKDGRYYLFFSANDPYPVDRKGGDFTPVKEIGIQKYGGIGVAVADRPEGPYEDLIGKPLIDQFWNKAQPIDQYVFDWKGEWYMVYGGWDRCALVRLAPDFKSVLPWSDGALWRDLTPPEYKEGPVMFERKGVWYFMYSSGTWTRDDYCIKYCMGPSPLGPFAYKGKILGIQRPIATGAGHHSVLCLPGTDDWFICYHRRPIPNLGKSHRVVCLDRMFFAPDGSILPVKMTATMPTLAASVAIGGLECVDPLIGTEGSGSEYGGMQPYTCVPFGSFHAVPMTRTNRIGRLSFNNADKDLLGIILTRQPAIWMGDWGEVRIPVRPAKIEALDAKPYLTRVTAGGRTYELAATAHAAWIRGLDAATVAAFPESGTNTNRMDAKYGYPLPNFGGRWFADKSCPGELKIGLSLISVEQAKANLADEIGNRSFDAVVAATKALWAELFARVEIEAPDDVRKIFYTGLYHTLLYPRQLDEGGRYYSAFDDKIHVGTRYNCYSLWDTYRTEHPWLTLVVPERIDGMMQSLVDMYKEGGWLPKWPNPSYTGIMIGAPAEVVLQEARAKGFTRFDWTMAQEAIRKNATVPQRHDVERRWEDRGMFGRAPETRAGLTSYLKRGYVACDETAESVSRTQDFALADRNRSYTNVWCAAEGMFLPRRADGSFVPRKALKRPYRDYCEQQPETGVWAVPHDPEGLAELMGGKAEAIRRLDEFFDTLFFRPDGRGNGSIHGNETSHHCAYLYNRFGAPEKTQWRVRQILTKCYSTNRKGFDGNEDCGQMSAWYILSALGFYPLDPASGEYELGSPLVRRAKLKIGSATLNVIVDGYAPDRWRVKRVTLNGVACANGRVRHRDLAAGGDLVFEMLPPIP